MGIRPPRRYVTRKRIAAAALALAALWGFFRLTRQEPPDQFLQLCEQIEQSATPPGATSFGVAMTSQSAWERTATWELETNHSWPEFSAWLCERHAPPFSKQAVAGEGLMLKQTTKGEVIQLTARPHPPQGDRLRVQLTLRVSAW